MPSYKPTPEDLTNTAAGHCTACDQYSKFRNTAGECLNCHNARYYKRKTEEKKHLEEMKAQGREYWRARGIKPGEKVQAFAPSMLGFGGVNVIGIAKVGKCGAYVSAPHFQAGQLAPAYFHKMKDSTSKGD